MRELSWKRRIPELSLDDLHDSLCKRWSMSCLKGFQESRLSAKRWILAID
jgi:hypothetical protein